MVKIGNSEHKAVITFLQQWCIDMSPYYPLCREDWIREIKSDDEFIKINGEMEYE